MVIIVLLMVATVRRMAGQPVLLCPRGIPDAHISLHTFKGTNKQKFKV